MPNLHLAAMSLLAGSLLFVAEAGGQERTDSTAHPFVGSWIYAEQPANVIDDAIERGIADMSFILRPIARRRLHATNHPYTTVELRVDGGEVTTVLEGRTIRAPGDGRAIAWRREDGELMQVATRVRDGTLVQTFVAEDGSRENVYAIAPDRRRMTLQVTIRSDRLPAPVRYRLLYDRAP